ncbi:L-aspartate oxidase [Enhygromyxa salina]|uniref:L-aspartate oxidase n=1 Tax=Enhygromyxa salina TaxID=215803 RepID=A0A0C1ZG33_9BACT|nr:L-aspartate oxidase [Enhygromyxa salina]KIG16589.1 L-aspartate oxidase [Enhygromyxa salina]
MPPPPEPVSNAPHVHHTDTLVLGSGLAGLYFALQVADRRSVTILTKHRRESSNTRWAQGGISAVFSPEDSLDAHVADTLAVGAGLCREAMVRRAVEHGPGIVVRLAEQFGVQFDRSGNDPSSPFELGREGGHSSRRVVHHRDMTGAEIERALIEAVERHPNIQILEHHDVIDLLSFAHLEAGSQDRGCFGCYALDIVNDRVLAFVSPVTVLATGGAGKVYRYTSNPHIATGDGIAMAYRIGAEVGNLEFMQFHPTILFHPDAKSFLISEALRGEGGILRTIGGQDLMQSRHPMGSLAPRDVVAREIDAELKRSGANNVLLDMTHLDHDFIVDRFPAIHARCTALGIDMRKVPIPVVPAAHYTCGGVVVDPWGRTAIPGLLAIGEVAMSGMHGACRLASNSLLEAVVLAAGAAEVCDEFGVTPPRKVEAWNEGDAVDSGEAVMVTANWEEVRALMWNYVGIVRSDKRLARARRRLEILHQEIREYYWHYRLTRDVLELRSIALVGYLMVESASRRRESRGLHYTLDYPQTDPGQARETIFTRQDGP